MKTDEQNNPMETEKVIIIGAGPTGLAAAIYNSRAELSPFVIAGSPPGGQLTLTSEVENYPGFESILGPKLIETMRAHAQKFGTRFVDDNVVSVDFSKQPLKLTTSSKKGFYAKTVLIATGASAMWLELENEQRLRGKGVSACATCDGFFFKDKVVAVIGGGDTAMEEALTLTKFASQVYVLHRRDEFRASQIMQKRVLKHHKIKILWSTEVVDVLGEERVEGLKLKLNSDKAKETVEGDILKVDGLFLAIGHKPNSDFLINSGVLIDNKGYVKTSGWVAWEARKDPNYKLSITNFNFNHQYQTSIPGVFAAGDVVDYAYRQAGTAVGMGIAAALDIERYLGEQGA